MFRKRHLVANYDAEKNLYRLPTSAMAPGDDSRTLAMFSTLSALSPVVLSPADLLSIKKKIIGSPFRADTNPPDLLGS